MKVVIDTNVLISGLFFGGTPDKIIDALLLKKFDLVISTEILKEYQRVVDDLSEKYPQVEVKPLFHSITRLAHIAVAEPLAEQICSDPDDDKFIACAASSQADVIVTGDKALQDVKEYKGVRILSPADFMAALA